MVNAALGAGLLNFPQAYHQAGGVVIAVAIQSVSRTLACLSVCLSVCWSIWVLLYLCLSPTMPLCLCVLCLFIHNVWGFFPSVHESDEMVNSIDIMLSILV